MVDLGGSRMKVEVGQVLSTRSFILDRAALKKYADASGDQNPIHQDEDFAKSVGLPDVIAHGMLTMALGATYLAEWAGGSSRIKSYQARFTKPVVVSKASPTEIIFEGKVIELNGDRASVELIARVGDQKVLGMAKATIELG